MTIQQEAIRMINSMPDDTVRLLVEFLKRMSDNSGFLADPHTSVNVSKQPTKRRLGLADGKYTIPDDIDFCNDEIAKMFGVAE